MSVPAAEDRGARRALVVDDDEGVRTLVRRVLTRRGYAVDEARDGAEAIERLSQRAYAVILLDLMMPRVNGYGVVRYLIDHQPQTLDKVIIMSAFGSRVLHEIVPVVRFIEKPFDIEQLVAAADGVASSREERPERRQTDAAAPAPPLRVLLVEDDAGYRAFAAALVRRLGFWVDTASDGEAALARLAQAPYDVAIIDQQMPRLTGIETIARVRADDATKMLYAIMLTAREDTDTKLAALDAGFDDFLTKASSEREIVAKLIAARRVALRQRTMTVAMRDLYGQAIHDDLTDVFNRRFFISEAERLLAEGTALNVILLDVDDFKQVNDTYGHLAGDDVLRDIGTALQSHTRPDDIVARFGGDEFVIAVPNLDAKVVETIAERLTGAIAALEWRVPPFRVSASSGFASSHFLEKPTLAQLFNAADRDMYKNKWVRKHPDLRPELYEYPARDRQSAEDRLKLREPAAGE